MRTRAHAADPTAIDIAYLASTYAVPEDNLQSLLDAPTTDLVRQLLASLTDKGQDFDELRTEKLKVDVELENTIRTSDTKVKAQKASVARHAKEVEELRIKLNESEAARETLASELDKLRSSTSGSSAETQALRQRIETLEASNRDALALVENKSTEKDRVATELSEQHSKLLALRREISQLEERNQSLENATSSQKFKEQSLQQEIDLLKRNNEWHSNELKTRTQEHAKFRKERNARMLSLEHDLEEANANKDNLKRIETSLRQRLDEVQAKADEAFARIATLQEEAARKEQSFRTEVSGSKRLSELQAQNAATHKARLLEVQAELEQIRDETRDEIGRLQAEIETERMDKEDAERKVAELELKVEGLEQRVARPGTPRQNGSVDPQTPGRLGSRAGSPSALPGSMRKVIGGLSFTQVYTKCKEAEEDLENERRRTNKLTAALDELITELESKKPEIEEYRLEQERMEEEMLNYSRLLDEANAGRDNATNQLEHWQGEADAAAREGQILRQQLRDLSAQVKILLVEVQSRDQGLGELSADERLELERAARGELDDGTLDEMTSTGRLISERLVIFRDVTEMQAKNEQLLRVTRTLGEKMEGEEAREKDRKSAADAQEVEELRQQVERYKDELQTTATQIDSYMKERDMFRRMLQHRGQVAPETDLQSMFGQSVPPATPGRGSVGPPATPRSKDVEDLNKLLKEQQTFFDQYRNESATDHRMLKDQVDALSREKISLQSELARVHSQLTLSSERYEMLQSNYNAVRSENGELQKRSQQLAEQAARQDLRTQQVAEELVEARSMTESLRNENANSKAEKELWKRIETRLTEDNKSLMDERSRLNKLITDLQNLQNERELAESESRRRLQSRLETLESELSDAKKKLDSEVEDGRKASLRRQYEEGQSRTRIDDLVKSLGNIREELVVAKTTRDQLQSRVDEMKIELRSAEEKVAALQPRPTPRAETRTNGELTTDPENELPLEQRLALEMSELRRDLELSKGELENAKQQIEQFRSIAQATEEELANFHQTADQYKEDTDGILAEKDARVKELEQRIEDLNSELTTTNSELSELRSKADDSSRLLAEQKASFEADTTRLRDDVDRYAEEKKLFQEDIKAQAEIAQDAQQSYEDELVKHAEAAKALQTVRMEYNELRTEVAGIKAEAEAAKASLESNEESWAEQRRRFERELDEAKQKRQDLNDQNKILHQNLETFSKELAALRQGRAGDSERAGTPSATGGDGNFQEVIKFLRREKEIVDAQYELSIRECKRLQEQLDYSNNQLEEAREKLAEERRQFADKSASEGNTSKLRKTIEELNLFRESATTLRNEAKQAREKLQEKTEQVERLFADIDPLKQRVGVLEEELETKEGNLKLLQDDRDHWRERTQNIISKYDRVDPAELEDMKKQLEQVKADKERLEAEQGPFREQIVNLEGRLASEASAAAQNLQERLDKIRSQAKEQDRRQRDKIRDIAAEKDNVSTDLEKARADLSSTNTELVQTKAALEEARANAAKASEDNAEEGQIREDGTAVGGEELAAMHARLASAQAAASEHASRAESLNGEMQSLQSRVQELEGQVAELSQQLEAATAQTGTAQSANITGDSDVLEKLKQDLETAQREVATLSASAKSASAEAPTANAQPAVGEKSVADQVADEVAKIRTEMEQQHELSKKQMEETYSRKMETLKSNLRRQLGDERTKVRTELQQELAATHSTEIQRLMDEHSAAIQKLQEAHKAELERLGQTGAVAIQKVETISPVKTEASSAGIDVSTLQLSDGQARELIKTNMVIRALLQQNLKAQIEKQTEKLRTAATEKDEEIKKLTEALEKTPADAETKGEMVSRDDLEKQLAAAQKQKDEAVRSAIDTAEKKTKLQLNSRDIAQAKLAVVRKAALDTPDKAVKEVWEIADKARPVPVAAKPADHTSTPTPAKPTEPATSLAQAPPLSDAPRMFGQPSRPSSSAGPNPNAANFNPGGSTTDATTAPPKPAAPATGLPAAPRAAPQSGIPQPGSSTAAGSKLPRAPGPPSRRTSMSGPSGIQFQGAANQTNRGGLQSSGLPRGGGFGRGGRGAGGGRGNFANAGQKRQHDGGGEGGDSKRTRGGSGGA